MAAAAGSEPGEASEEAVHFDAWFSGLYNFLPCEAEMQNCTGCGACAARGCSVSGPWVTSLNLFSAPHPVDVTRGCSLKQPPCWVIALL